MNTACRTLRWSTWLGWQIDSNWANPWLFALYVLIKPLAGSLLLVCMYLAARSATESGPAIDYLSFLYISTACFMLIGGVMFGMSHAVVTDRESYGMLKFIRISPAHLQFYLIGRGLSRAGQALVGAILTVAVGLAVFSDLRASLNVQSIAWHWLLFYLVCGAAMLISLGLILASTVLNMSRHGMFLSEGVAGLLYLLCGAVFPIDVLPGWMRPFSLALPPTYWLEGMRRALLGSGSSHSALSSWPHLHLATALAASTLMLVVFAHVLFKRCENRAWRMGKFDETSGS
ncbi:MAG: ABC transporter permease [Gemmataceae bacterium]